MRGMIDGVKPERTEADLLYEILLKMGCPLTAEITAQEIDGLTTYQVENGRMLVCLRPGINAEQIEKMAALAPEKVVLAESALADDSALSNAHYLLENRGIELKLI